MCSDVERPGCTAIKASWRVAMVRASRPDSRFRLARARAVAGWRANGSGPGRAVALSRPFGSGPGRAVALGRSFGSGSGRGVALSPLPGSGYGRGAVSSSPLGSTAGPTAVATVAAVVVTHRRPRLATQVVAGLVEREGLDPSQIFLVVNGEGGLDDAELEAAVRTVRLAENLGPAAGFRAGMLAAFGSGPYRWAYCCEDDVGLFELPSPRLAGLLASVDAFEAARGVLPIGAVVAYGRDLDRRTGHTVVHESAAQSGLEVVDVASWGASLVSRRVLEAGVVPADEWFFAFEDFDFFLRVRRAGLLVLEDRLAASAVAAQMSLAGRDAALGRDRPLDAEEPWRAYYPARNYFRLARLQGRPSWAVAHVAYSARRIQLAGSAPERGAILVGLADGIRGRTGPNPRFQRSVGERSTGLRRPGDPAASRGVEAGLPRGEAARPGSGGGGGGGDVGGPRERVVVHVLPNDVARGAQVSARATCRVLDRPGDRHQLLTIFAAPPAVLGADHRLDARSGWWRARGFDPFAAWRLRRELRELRPDVIVAHGGEPLEYLALTRPAGTPLVYFALGIVTDDARRGWRHLLYRWLYHRADVVAGISDACVDEARKCFGVPPARLALLPNARDPEAYRPRPRGATPGSGAGGGGTGRAGGTWGNDPDGTAQDDRGDDAAVRLLFVGHLTATKRPERFVALVEALRRRGLAIEGVLVGDGPLEAALRASVIPGVTLLGRRDDIPEQLQAADVLVFPSVPESEGMPGVLIEAGLAALPVVATDCPGVRDVVVDGQTGFVVGVHDDDAMEEATARLVGDRALRVTMGAAAREHCVERFSLAASAARWRALLDRLSPLAVESGDPGERLETNRRASPLRSGGAS